MRNKLILTTVTLLALSGCSGGETTEAAPTAPASPPSSPLSSAAPDEGVASTPAASASPRAASTSATTGTGTDGQRSGTARPAASAGETARSRRTAEDFVSAVHARVPEAAVDRRDEELAEIGDQACASLAEGADADTVVRDTGTDEAVGRELVKVAIGTVCPGQKARADEF